MIQLEALFGIGPLYVCFLLLPTMTSAIVVGWLRRKGLNTMAGARKGSDQIKVARAVVRGQGERMSNGREDGEGGWGRV